MKKKDGMCPTALLDCLENDFLSLVQAAYPEVRGILSRLRDSGAQVASLSGSGSALYGVFLDGRLASHVVAQFAREGYRAYLCRPVRV